MDEVFTCNCLLLQLSTILISSLSFVLMQLVKGEYFLGQRQNTDPHSDESADRLLMKAIDHQNTTPRMFLMWSLSVFSRVCDKRKMYFNPNCDLCSWSDDFPAAGECKPVWTSSSTTLNWRLSCNTCDRFFQRSLAALTLPACVLANRVTWNCR